MPFDDESRLRRVFQRILLASLGVPPIAFVACSDDNPTNVVPIQVKGSDVEVFDACAPTVRDVLLTTIDGEPICYAFHVHECGIPEGIVQADAGCSFSLNDCQKLCPLSGAYFCNSIDNSCDDAGMVIYDGAFNVACEFCPSNIGRRPAGLVLASGARATSALGDHFARMSELEAASVVAFERLARELVQHAAPRSLIRAADRARRDEIRHAALTEKIARRFGGEPAATSIEAPRSRSVQEIARENAVEGCVRETYGALVAHFQARRAQDPEIAAALAEIAEDETRHAALGWAVARWADSRLSKAERRNVERRRQKSVPSLEREIQEPARALVALAGLPKAREERRLLAALRTTLWS